MTDHDAVSGFSYELLTVDGCEMTNRYRVNMGEILEMPNAVWRPMSPAGSVGQATLTTEYVSGKRLKIEIEGAEHSMLSITGRFDKMLSSIVRGNMPGEALKRQLTKAFDLPKLPKLKRPKLS